MDDVQYKGLKIKKVLIKDVEDEKEFEVIDGQEIGSFVL